MEHDGRQGAARKAMREAGLPLVPGSPGRLATAEEAAPIADELGYPVLLKAAAGGGGRGMRVVEDRERPRRRCSEPRRRGAGRRSATAACTSRRLVEAPRHVEIQVLADGHGGVAHLGERECSIQRRHQKLLEEAPSPALDDAERATRWPRRPSSACRAIGYRNAGTIEFLVGADGKFYFMEMNTRIQVEHPVTEMVTGIDLVREQLRVAAGERLRRAPAASELRGHAIECRINAEDPSKGFAPIAGTDHALRSAGRPGRPRRHAHLRGYVMPPNYDSLLAKVIVHAEDREACIARSTARSARSGSRASRRRATCTSTCSQRGAVPQRPVHDVVHRGGGRRPAPPGVGMSEHPYRRVEGAARRTRSRRTRSTRPPARPRRWSTASRSRASGSPARAVAVRTSRSTARRCGRGSRSRAGTARSLPEAARDVQRHVTATLRTLTGLEVDGVDVEVVAVTR